MTAQVVSVALLASYIRELFESDPLLSDIWVEGEVSDVFTSRAGHVYFTMRDAESQLKCVLFKGAASRQRVLPVVGDQVAAHGRVTTYERDGVYQLYVDVVEHAGKGLLALQFERLRQKLEADGLFDESRKRKLPAMPVWIGVVTSAEGAVWHDIQNVLRRRYRLAHLLLAPAPVQGPLAPEGIVAALERLQRDGRAELVIVARGGGSAEDLACFNDERVARAVFACKMPVISAVGHETDWTIIDLVADLRAPTPSAAAELCAPSIQSLREECDLVHGRIASAISTLLRDWRNRASEEGRRLDRVSPEAILMRQREEVERLTRASRTARSAMLPKRKADLTEVTQRLRHLGQSALAGRRGEIRRLTGILHALDPAGVIGRGYAMVESAPSGRLLTWAGDIHVGDRLSVRMSGGNVLTAVERVDATRGVGQNG